MAKGFHFYYVCVSILEFCTRHAIKACAINSISAPLIQNSFCCGIYSVFLYVSLLLYAYVLFFVDDPKNNLFRAMSNNNTIWICELIKFWVFFLNSWACFSYLLNWNNNNTLEIFELISFHSRIVDQIPIVRLRIRYE